MKNVRKHRDIKVTATEKKKELLKKNHISKWLSENLLAMEMNKTKVKMNKLVSLGLSLLDISQVVMYEYWYY